MVKGDDVVRRKKNKALRKKLQKDSSSVSARVASIIAAKKRRQFGKRRKCQGMCFSLPTPEDPFNDRQGKLVEGKQEKKNAAKYKKDDKRNRPSVSDENNTDGKGSKSLKVVELEKKRQKDAFTDEKKLQKLVNLGTIEKQSKKEYEAVDYVHDKDFELSDGPSKFLVLCLKSIQDALVVDGGMNMEDSIPLFANPWGVDFWKCYSAGKNILEASGNSPNIQQIAWMVSTAADSIARKEKEGESFASPFLLYLVPSQQHASEVRFVCKPLKALGIHTVSLHPGALIDHQINGLKSCEPEFLVATPERLWELISLKAIDISGVSLLVVDGMDVFSESGCLDVVKHISQSISKSSRAVVFQGHSSVQAPNSIVSVKGPFCKLSVGHSAKSNHAYIEGRKEVVEVV